MNWFKIYYKIKTLEINDYDISIWAFFNTYNINLLSLLNNENQPYEIFPITQMYSFWNKSNIFCITYKVKKYCKFYEINKLNNEEVL